jgi:NAD(P)-dependent dehydrogenase (short-subunit alcohol dehydrogenase family)
MKFVQGSPIGDFRQPACSSTTVFLTTYGWRFDCFYVISRVRRPIRLLAEMGGLNLNLLGQGLSNAVVESFHRWDLVSTNQEIWNMANSQKVALVTGSNRGIGFETARQLGQQGVTVIVSARTANEAAEAAGKLRGEGTEAVSIALDVTKAADHTAAAHFIESRYGKLDILVNNAGAGPADGLIGLRASASSQDELQTLFNINVFSLVGLTHELLPLLKKSEAGRIVNLASILGSLTIQAMDPSPIAPLRKFAYNASKAAVNVFTIHLAAELKGTNIKVNSVHPGWVKTALGSDAAPMSVPDGAKTTVAVALLGSDGPNGRFIHEINQELPW